jgi:hypothetical protein
MFWIYIGTDARGSFPWLQWSDKALPECTIRWRLLARTDDPELASLLMQQAHEECYGAGKRPPA